MEDEQKILHYRHDEPTAALLAKLAWLRAADNMPAEWHASRAKDAKRDD